MTQLVNAMKYPGFRTDPDCVYIGRKFAGFPESDFANRAFGKNGGYEPRFLKRMVEERGYAAKVMNLHGKKLGCPNRNCPEPGPCHGAIIAKWADRIYDKWEELQHDKAAMQSWLKGMILACD